MVKEKRKERDLGVTVNMKPDEIKRINEAVARINKNPENNAIVYRGGFIKACALREANKVLKKGK